MPVFWMPSPRQLRAGAVWVTAKNWLMAAERRFGEAALMCPDGVLDRDALRRATEHHGGPRPAGRPSPVRIVAETLAKDVRWLWRDLRVLVRPPRAPVPRFVWQHHDLFQTGGGRLARRHGVPLVHFVDAPYVWEASRWGVRRPGWGRLVERFGDAREMRRADLVLCVSEEVRNKVVELGVDPHRALVTPCTADPNDHLHARSKRVASDLEGRTVVGWLGSFRSFHRLDMLADAVAAAATGVEQLALLLVGDGAERERAVGYARSLGIHTVAPGAVPHEEVPDWLATMDIAVVLADGQQAFHYSPLKLKEYMAAGLAVVAPRLGEMARVLRHGEDALLYEPGDVEQLAACIVQLATDPELRQRVGEAARATVRAHFSADRQLDEVIRRLGIEAPPLPG